MFENKYSNVLTVILVIIIIAIIALLGYFGFEMIQKNSKEKAAQQTVDEYDKMFQNKVENTTVAENNTTLENVVNPYDSLQDQDSSSGGSSTSSDNVYMEGYEVKGTITIPATNVRYPVLERVTKRSIEIAVGILYPEGCELNQEKNTVIAGHNYRNGTFFSDNKKLQVGDKIYIKDKTGTTVTYVIYDMFETTSDDADYMLREIGDKREISLSTCTDDVSGRLIILAREQ